VALQSTYTNTLIRVLRHNAAASEYPTSLMFDCRRSKRLGYRCSFWYLYGDKRSTPGIFNPRFTIRTVPDRK